MAATAASVAAVSGPSVSVTTLVSVPVSAFTVLVSSTFLTVGAAAASPPVVTGATGAAAGATVGCTLATAWSANVCVWSTVGCNASSAALSAAAFALSASPSIRPTRVPYAPVAVPITPPTPAPKTAPRPTARLNAAWSKPPFCSPMSCLYACSDALMIASWPAEIAPSLTAAAPAPLSVELTGAAFPAATAVRIAPCDIPFAAKPPMRLIGSSRTDVAMSPAAPRPRPPSW